MSSILVIGETDGDEIKEVSQQVAAVASGMGEVVGIVMGKNIADAAMKLATSKIIIADDESLEYYDPVKLNHRSNNKLEKMLAGSQKEG